MSSGAAASPRKSQGDEFAWPPVSRRRRVGNAVFWGLGFICLVLVVAPTIWLVGGVVVKAVPNFQWSVITTDTTGADVGGRCFAWYSSDSHQRGRWRASASVIVDGTTAPYAPRLSIARIICADSRRASVSRASTSHDRSSAARHLPR